MMKSGFRKILAVLLVIMIIQPLLMDAGLAAVLTFPPRVVRIEDSTFENDRSLDEVLLPDGVESIGPRAFAGAAIRKINLPSSLNFIAEDAFDRAEVGAFEAKRNTYAWQWLEDHNLLLHFSDDAMYDVSVDMAVFQPDEAIGLGSDWFACWYELREYEEWKDSVASDPVWSVIQTSGPEAEYALQHYDGQASFSVAMPESPAVYTFTISCFWEGRSLSTGVTVRYVSPGSLPTGTDIPDEIALTKDQENVLPFHFTPSGFSFGQMNRVGFENYTGEAEAWYEGHDLHIIPRESGTFAGDILLYAGNMYISRHVVFQVRALPEQITRQMENLVDEETGKINLDALTPIPTNDVTDPEDLEKILEFNGALPQLQEKASAYNTALDGLYVSLDAVIEALGEVTVDGTETSFGITSNLGVFSCGEGVSEWLDGEYEIVSADFTDGDAALLTVRKGDKEGVLRITETGISVVGRTSTKRNFLAGLISGAEADSADAGGDESLSFLSGYRDFLNEYSGPISALSDAEDLVREAAGEFIPGVADFANTFAGGVLGKLIAGLGLLDGFREAKADILRYQSLWQQYDDILSIKNHGHPTEMEARDPDMMSTVLALRSEIGYAIALYGADVTATLADLAYTYAKLYRDLTKGLKEQAEDLPVAKKVLASMKRAFKWDPDFNMEVVDKVKDRLRENLHRRFLEAYWLVRYLDRELHYDFSGIVYDPDMKPLQGARVTLGCNTVYSDARGSYEMESPTSVATPVFSFDGYREISDKSVSMIPYEKATLSVQMEEAPRAVAGRVYDQDTNQPLSGASVSFDGKYAVSDTEGSYAIQSHPGRTADLTARLQGYAPWKEQVTVSRSEEITRKDIYMRPVGKYTISGTVRGHSYDPVTGKWATVPLPGAAVSWSGGTAVSDENGKYEITVEEQTSMEVSFSRDPDYTPAVRTLEFACSEYVVKENVDCTLQMKYGWLDIRVQTEHQGSNALTCYIPEDVKVTIGGVIERSGPCSVMLPAGVYDVSVDGTEAGLGEKSAGSVPVEDGKTTTVTAALPWKKGLRGQILNEDGTPVAGMKVTATGYNPTGTREITTDEEGKFYLFTNYEGMSGSFNLRGSFVSEDYRSKNRVELYANPDLLLDEIYTVRLTEGKFVRSLTLNMKLYSGQEVTKQLTADVSWENWNLHLDYASDISHLRYLVASDESVILRVTASGGIDGKVYTRTFSGPIGSFDTSLDMIN